MDSLATNLLQDWLLETNCLLFVSVSGTKKEIHYLAIHQSNRDGRIFINGNYCVMSAFRG